MTPDYSDFWLNLLQLVLYILLFGLLVFTVTTAVSIGINLGACHG